MAFSASTARWLILSVLFVSTCKFGRAYNYPHLGAAGVVANEYLPKAEVEGEVDQYFPQTGIIGTGAALLLGKALSCLSDKYIYSSCEKSHRLGESGELNVPPEYTDEYCQGPCLAETHHALDCIDKILKRFIFLNRATLHDVRETIESGCSHGPKRGNFDVVGHIQSGNAGKNKVSNGVVCAILVMVAVLNWREMM
ncbi:hypothetical protein ACS0TY_027231 [Phlomoides rotata]